MKLSEKDSKLFFDLMWALQFYVNQKLKIHDVQNLDDYTGLPTQQKATVRDALYKKIELIDSFVEENPQIFSKENLAIILEWKKFIRGDFFIERLLKKYAVFIKDAKVYGVLGLFQSFEQLTFNRNLPLYVEAVLLPFKGKIIYDGLFVSRNMYFGGGIKRSLKETYLRAKQNHRIIDSLNQSGAEKQKKAAPKSLKNWKPEMEELACKAKKLKGSAAHPAIYTPAFSLVKAAIEFAQIAVSDEDHSEGLHMALKRVGRAFNNATTVLHREEY